MITILVLGGPKISKYKDLREGPYSLTMYVPGVLIFQNFRIQENNLVGGNKFFYHSTHSQPGLSAFIYQPLVPIIDSSVQCVQVVNVQLVIFIISHLLCRHHGRCFRWL